MSNVDQEDLPEENGRGDRLFTRAATVFVVTMVLVVPLATWIGKRFFGWQPPSFLAKILSYLDM